jgi:hypothetical protein
MNVKQTAIVLILLIVHFGISVQAKKTINLKNAKLAIEVDIQDLYSQVRMGVTIFGNHQGNLEKHDYQMPIYLKKHLEMIFSDLGVDYDFVVKDVATEQELKHLKKRERRKLSQKYHDKFIKGLRDQNYTDLLSFKFFSHSLDRYYKSSITPNIHGYGVYKIPGSHCIYHTLGYFHVNLKRPKKFEKYEIKKTIPERQKVDHTCIFGVGAKKVGIKWLKNAENYTEDQQAIIEKTIKDLVLESLLDTFSRHGLIINQVQANQMFIKLMKSNFIVVEKEANDFFKIDDEVFSSGQLVDYLEALVNQKQRLKILVGYETKSRFTFGDLKNIFIPPTKDSEVVLFRLGPQYELIKI